ncbi:unnamed protein product [Rotaria sp. Silwood1]|nr:unnamed protein product [Rotaria sp. Silwood1]
MSVLFPIKVLSDKVKAKVLNYGKVQQLIVSIIEDINLKDKPTQHRKRAISIRFKDSVTTSTIGQHDDNDNEQYYRTYIYYQSIDNIIVELKGRFSSKTLNILSSVSSVCPDSVGLYQELYPFTEAFSTLIALIKSAMTIPISLTTCERAFSKMKLIKTTVRNTMYDDRLSDLCLLAVERNIDVRFE